MKVGKISVVTVCLNAQDCIRLTLESVASQSFANMEHVVIDGGSTDGTQKIVEEYAVGHFVSEKDNGVYDAMDKGAKVATGDILIFLNAGDTFYDNFVSEEVAAFFNQTNADIVFGNLLPVYLRSTDSHDHDAFNAGELLELGYMRNKRQLYDESIHHQATFYRKWIFDRCTYLCSNPKGNGEYNLLLNAALTQKARIKHITRPVSRFVLGGISTKNFETEWKKYVEARDILRNIYCPSQAGIKIKNEFEFQSSRRKLKVDSVSAKIRAKQVIKKSILFRMYDRLALSMSSRVVHILTPTLENMFADQARRFTSDLNELKRMTTSLEASADTNRRMQQDAAKGIRDELAAQQDTAKGIRDELVALRMQIGALHRSAMQTAVNLSDVMLNQPKPDGFAHHGFKVFSQWNEDGLIQYLISRIRDCKNTFVEIGVGNYTESNTRLLVEKDFWSGLIVDCNSQDITEIQSSELYWKRKITAVDAFVTRENINDILIDNNVVGEIGVLSIDVDGVDYWLWEAVTAISPQIVICEYNALFGPDAAVTVPYDPHFDRTKKHYSWLYAGASLAALQSLGARKGYALVGTNNGGNNAFFVREDILEKSAIVSTKPLFTPAAFRESRSENGALTYLDASEAIKLIGDMEVYDTEAQTLLPVKNIPAGHRATD